MTCAAPPPLPPPLGGAAQSDWPGALAHASASRSCAPRHAANSWKAKRESLSTVSSCRAPSAGQQAAPLWRPGCPVSDGPGGTTASTATATAAGAAAVRLFEQGRRAGAAAIALPACDGSGAGLLACCCGTARFAAAAASKPTSTRARRRAMPAHLGVPSARRPPTAPAQRVSSARAAAAVAAEPPDAPAAAGAGPLVASVGLQLPLPLLPFAGIIPYDP
jgi:hypothetical protein